MPAAPYTEDPMAGFDPSRPEVSPAAPTTEQSGYEFNPQKEIDPLAGRFFADIEANTGLSSTDKLRIQSGYLQGIANVREQRDKIERERLSNLMDRQRMEVTNFALVEARQKQEDIARSTEQKKGLAETINGIRNSNLPPSEKRQQLATLEIERAALFVTDPASKVMIGAAKEALPKDDGVFDDEYITDLIVNKNVPIEIARSRNPELIRRVIEKQAALKESQSTDAKIATEGRKKEAALLTDFGDLEMKFMEEKDLPEDVSSNDPNRLKYLTPESQDKALIFVGALGDAEGKDLKHYKSLSDAQKKDFINEMQVRVMREGLRKLSQPIEDTVEENAVDSLFKPKKR